MKKLLLLAVLAMSLSSCEKTENYKVYLISDSVYQLKKDSLNDAIVLKKGDHLLLSGSYHDADEWFVVTTNKNGAYLEQRYLNTRLTLKFWPWHDIRCDKAYKNLSR